LAKKEAKKQHLVATVVLLVRGSGCGSKTRDARVLAVEKKMR
jgi:hypothetical protein